MPKFKQNNSLNLTWENIKWHVSLNPVLKEKKKEVFLIVGGALLHVYF